MHPLNAVERLFGAAALDKAERIHLSHLRVSRTAAGAPAAATSAKAPAPSHAPASSFVPASAYRAPRACARSRLPGRGTNGARARCSAQQQQALPATPSRAGRIDSCAAALGRASQARCRACCQAHCRGSTTTTTTTAVIYTNKARRDGSAKAQTTAVSRSTGVYTASAHSATQPSSARGATQDDDIAAPQGRCRAVASARAAAAQLPAARLAAARQPSAVKSFF